MHSSLRRLGALLSGLLLYCVVMLFVSTLAALPSPAPLLSHLGLRAMLAQEIGAATLLATPVFGLALVWSYVTIRPSQRGRRPTTAWCLGGLCLAWLAWLFYGLVHASENSALGELPLSTLLLSSSVPPLWGVLNMLAAMLGVIQAGTLAKRRMPPTAALRTQVA
ncbi:hypothetical protein [Roseateles sp.]|jgi:hypothetical protein|uniref:hypothetical protein n=1 Tax=Roseateles sp. TaxID=1971397 RepID=UPI0037CACCF5